MDNSDQSVLERPIAFFAIGEAVSCIVGACVIFLIYWGIYWGISCVLDGYTCWGREAFVLETATKYLENSPDWPKSWDDLEQVRIQFQSDEFPLPSPDDFAGCKKDVFVDFNLTRAQVAAMTVQDFKAIHARRPTAGPNDQEIRELLAMARQDDGCTVLEVLAIYLKNHAKWPKDWKDLQQSRVPWDSYSPTQKDLDQWKKQVIVDFGTTRAKVAALTVENFTAVKPIRAIYGPREQRIKDLLEVARQQPEIPEAP